MRWMSFPRKLRSLDDAGSSGGERGVVGIGIVSVATLIRTGDVGNDCRLFVIDLDYGNLSEKRRGQRRR
jgi:hypothetical protein